MTFYHENLAQGRWTKLTLSEQMANVGSEIERTIKWREKNSKFSQMAFERALELLDLTATDKKNRLRLKEILRAREALADYFQFNNLYKSTDQKWQNYFYSFAYAARNKSY
ncbi:hypothetical protein D4R86_05565 [bacterium]|nr:MAG: hypothetical protein D4R86_05565 [bacterium]